jgi:uncharacterized protein YbjT (DUF2867 family)
VTTLVLGHGTTGRRVIERLQERGSPARVLPRFDWHDQSSWAPAHHDVGDPGALPAEKGLRASGADWTIVRASLLDRTFSEGCLLRPVEEAE